MLPNLPMNILLGDVARAVKLAADGHVAAGYDHLLGGLRRAEAVDQAGEPWGAVLVRRYRQALDSYTERYGVEME
jgi:hypothetical protein